MNAWQFVVPFLGWFFVTFWKGSVRSLWITWWLFLLKLKDQPTYPMLRNLKESHQKPIIFHHKKFPPTSPNLEPVASFRSPCIPGFNRLQVKGRPRLKSMPKGLASWTNETTSWRVNKKWAHSKTFPKYPWNIPQIRNLHSLWRYFFPCWSFGDAARRFLGYVGGFLEQPCVRASLWNKMHGFILILCRDDCIDMQLEKSCMQTSLASKHGNSLNLWWYSVYAHINICGCISMIFQLLWMTNEKSCSIYKGTQGHPEIWEVLFMQIHVFSYLKTANIMSMPQYSIIQHDTTPQARIYFALNLSIKQSEVAHINDLDWLFFSSDVQITKNKLFIQKLFRGKIPCFFWKPMASWWFQPIWKIWVKMGSSSPTRNENNK